MVVFLKAFQHSVFLDLVSPVIGNALTVGHHCVSEVELWMLRRHFFLWSLMFCICYIRKCLDFCACSVVFSFVCWRHDCALFKVGADVYHLASELWPVLLYNRSRATTTKPMRSTAASSFIGRKGGLWQLSRAQEILMISGHFLGPASLSHFPPHTCCSLSVSKRPLASHANYLFMESNSLNIF